MCSLQRAASGVASRVDTIFLNSRKQSCSIQAHFCGGAICATNPSLAFGKRLDDLFALLLGKFIAEVFLAIQSSDRFLDDSGDVVLWRLDGRGFDAVFA